MLIRNVSVIFWVTIEIACRSVVIHKNFLSLFPFPPYPPKSTPKISLCLWYKVLAKILQLIHPSRASHLQYLETQVWTCLF